MNKIQINKIYNEDCRETLNRMPDEFINGIVTSPPYWGLRDYGFDGQIGLEKTPELYIQHLVEIFREIKRVLKKDGTVWLNLGDSYATQSGTYGGNNKYKGIQKNIKGNNFKQQAPTNIGLKHKDLCLIPTRVAIALQKDGWYIRSDIIWHKPNPMPESVKDRPTKSHEHIFLITKSAKYYYDAEAIMEKSIDNESYTGRRKRNIHKIALYDPEHADNLSKGNIHNIGKKYPLKNKRDVWTVNTKPYSEAHFAVFPEELIIPCIKTMPKNAIVYDPFMGSGTTAVVAYKLGRRFIGSEANQEYCKMAEKRLKPIMSQMSLV